MRSTGGEFRLRLRVVVLGQAFDLLDVEHRVAFQERDLALDLLAFGVLLGAREGVGIDDQRALLALADVGVQFERLLERHPTRRSEAVFERRDAQSIRMLMPE